MLTMTRQTPVTVRSVLFDLDGTLLDTAPDLAFALNTVLKEEGRDPLPFDAIRPHVSTGAGGLLRLGFGTLVDELSFQPVRERFLQIYRSNLARETILFPGMAELLAALEQQNIRWGVVTNKPAWLTDPLMRALRLAERASCVVSGDTTPHKKPHPAPILYACEHSKCEPGGCIYVGDAYRDIEAGRNAGMKTVVALFGYLGENDAPQAWGADAMVEHPLDILDYIEALHSQDKAAN